MRKRNFTLIELLTVIIIIGILTGLIMAALTGGREQARRTEAKIQAESLRSAISQYESDYGKMPLDTAGEIGGSGENSSDTNYVNLIEEITGGNPRSISYISVDEDDEYRDPWGQEYVVVLDTDYNGEIQVTYTDRDGNSQTKTLNRSAAAWSLGNPDKDDGPVLPWD